MTIPQKCDKCDGNGLLLGEKWKNLQAVALKKRPPYYPERHLLVRDETLDEWKVSLARDIAKYEAQVEKLLGGIDQINEELARRAMGKVQKA